MHFIFCVHGIGTHSNDWITDKDDWTSAPDLQTSLAKQLKSKWEQYPSAVKRFPFDVGFKVISIHYDDVYTQLYQKWAESVDALLVFLSATPEIKAELGDWIEEIKAPSKGVADDKFFFTHILDVLWYRFSGAIQNKIVDYVAKQMLGHIKINTDPLNTFSIVAHSMGTSVTHKFLQAMYSAPAYRDVISANFKFNVIAQIANASLALSDKPSAHYDNCVKPSAFANRGVCWWMLNISNRYDLVSELIPFRPPLDTWLDAASKSKHSYIDIRTERVCSVDVHSICHYLENPAVHIAIFEKIADFQIDNDEKIKCLTLFEGRTPEGAFKNAKQSYVQLQDSRKNPGSVAAFVKSVRTFVEIIRTYKD